MESKAGASPAPIFRGEFPSVAFGNFGRDGEAETEAKLTGIAFRRHVWFKNPVDKLTGDATAGIFNLDGNALLKEFGGEANFSALGGGLAGIDEEVGEDLVDVGGRRPFGGKGIEIEVEGVIFQPVVENGDGVENDFIEGLQFGFFPDRLPVRFQTFDKAGDPVHRNFDIVEVGTNGKINELFIEFFANPRFFGAFEEGAYFGKSLPGKRLDLSEEGAGKIREFDLELIHLFAHGCGIFRTGGEALGEHERLILVGGETVSLFEPLGNLPGKRFGGMFKGGARVVDFVGDAGEKLPENGEAFLVNELLAGFLKITDRFSQFRSIRLQLLGEVVYGDIEGHHMPVAIRHAIGHEAIQRKRGLRMGSDEVFKLRAVDLDTSYASPGSGMGKSLRLRPEGEEPEEAAGLEGIDIERAVVGGSSIHVDLTLHNQVEAVIGDAFLKDRFSFLVSDAREMKVCCKTFEVLNDRLEVLFHGFGFGDFHTGWKVQVLKLVKGRGSKSRSVVTSRTASRLPR